MGLYKRTKNTNTPLLRQILDLVPGWIFSRSTTQHKSDKGCSRNKAYDQFVALTFGQLNKCYTLSDISTGIDLYKQFESYFNYYNNQRRHQGIENQIPFKRYLIKQLKVA